MVPIWLRTSVLGLAALCVARPELPKVPADPVLVDDPMALAILEDRGLGFERIVGKRRLATIEEAIEADLHDLTDGDASPRRPFRTRWLKKGWFELVGVVNRIDRRRFEPDTCGEVRLVYRLAIRNPRRPVTRLPMTINVRIPQPRLHGEDDCRGVAKRWLDHEDVGAIIATLPPPRLLEIDYQSTHTPGTKADMDDSAAYALRAFRFEGEALVPDSLFNTPRPDLDPAAREDLRAWVDAHRASIDDGTAIVPAQFLATRAVSVSPRGLARPENRPFSALLAGTKGNDAELPPLVLRRLDEATCVGCHQTRSVAGFHLLGEERDPHQLANALAVGHSPHLAFDLRFRADDLARVARGEPMLPRPFAAFPNGELGSDCGVTPGFASWICKPGLVCRDIHHADVGVCVTAGSNAPGATCEDVDGIAPSERAEGPVVRARTPDATCPAPDPARFAGPFCAPNWLGFTGGMCSTPCDAVGTVVPAAAGATPAICAALPAAGYEADCFVGREPIEKCLPRHLVHAFVGACDREHPCRDDFGCARVPNAPLGVGACVPPYFVFQARVDGPNLDR